jgi:CRP-like cAMP-binding protein
VTELETYIQSYFVATEADLGTISSFFQPVSLKKGDYFLKTGRMADRMGFIQSGLLREFILVDGKEVTKWVSTNGYFVVDIAAFLFQQSARWNIQALSDCKLHVIDRDRYQQLQTAVPGWPELEKLFIAKCFIILEQRVVSHLSMTAEERYQQLFQFNPDLFNLVPLHYLASMLGITPETLSRIRNKAMKPNS